MAHEEADMVRQHLHFKEQDHIHIDGTRRGGNRQAALVLQTRHVLLPDGTQRGGNRGGSTCASKNKTTYFLMAHEEAETVKQHLRFKL
jgi:hypothetical protein